MTTPLGNQPDTACDSGISDTENPFFGKIERLRSLEVDDSLSLP